MRLATHEFQYAGSVGSYSSFQLSAKRTPYFDYSYIHIHSRITFLLKYLLADAKTSGTSSFWSLTFLR